MDGSNLAVGSYRARIVSGLNQAEAPLRPSIGDEVEFDFDSNPDDIAAGATAIAVGFLQGNPPTVTGEIRTSAGAVVIQAMATCTQA